LKSALSLLVGIDRMSEEKTGIRKLIISKLLK